MAKMGLAIGRLVCGRSFRLDLGRTEIWTAPATVATKLHTKGSNCASGFIVQLDVRKGPVESIYYI